jgi:rhodanese-related sulfurtransferase/peroxiredoxin
MSMFERARNLVSWAPPQVGTAAHRISLTADEGTWVKLEDFLEHLNVVLIVFDSLTDTAVDQWLKEWNRRVGQFESLETVVFGIHSARTDDLRSYRQQLGLEFFLLYDPLAIESRALRCSSRLAPVCKTTVLVVGKDGRILFSERGQTDPVRVLEVISGIEGREAAQLKAESETPAGGPNTGPGTGPAPVQNIDSAGAETFLDEDGGSYVLIDVRTLSEYEADHSPNAVHIPIDELPHRYRELKQTHRIICVCQAGGRSAAAAEFLTSIGGSEIFNVEGGMSAWSGRRVTGGQLQS